MDPIACPAAEELAAFNLGDLSEIVLLAVADHLESCPRCQAKVRELDSLSDPVLVALRRPAGPAPDTPHGGEVSPGTLDAAARTGAAGPDGRLLHRLGDYRIVRELGRGGMGIVYEAEQVSLGRLVALKVLPAHAMLDPDRHQRFRREARAAARLHHTNIVPVFGVGQHEGLQYYVMQYIPGLGLNTVLAELRKVRPGDSPASLPARGPAGAVTGGPAAVAWGLRTGILRVGGPMSVDADTVRPPDSSGTQATHPQPAPLPIRAETASADVLATGGLRSGPSLRSYFINVARIGIQVAEALAYAHSQGILHRDIKPSNLLLDHQGTVWVTDFGLAKEVGDGEGLTHTGDLVGTLSYMAPERFGGSCDGRSDLYSLGLTLYELLTLCVAFEDADRNKLLQRVMQGTVPRPCKLVPEVPRDLETIVLKATSREPAHRYPSAADLAEDLKRFVDDKPIRARRVGPGERMARWGRRHPLQAGLLAALILAIGIGFFGISWGYWQAERARRNELQQRQEAEQSLYYSQIAQARLEWQANNVAGAEKLLDECQIERRGWEWRYLKRLCHADLVPGLGHEAWVWSVAFHPDGRRLASVGGGDPFYGNPGHTPQPGEVVVWDTRTGRKLLTLREQQHLVTSVAFSPDGRRLAAASWDQSVKLWDAETGALLKTFRDNATYASCLAFSPTGNALVTCDARGNGLVRDLVTEKEAIPLKGHTALIQAIAYAPDGRTVATASRDRTVRLWDPSTGTERHRLAGPGLSLAVAFSPDNRRVAAGGAEGVRVYDVVTGQQVYELVDQQTVHAVAFSPDGHYLASGGEDAAIRIWDAERGRRVLVLCGHRQTVTCLHFSPDGRRLASGGWDGAVKIWDATRNPESVLLLDRPYHSFQGLAWKDEGRQVALTGNMGSELVCVEAATGVVRQDQAVDITHWYEAPAAKGAFDERARWLATVSRLDASVVTLTAVETGKEVGRLHGHRVPLRQLAFSPDGRRLASGGTGPAPERTAEVNVWELTADGAPPAGPLHVFARNHLLVLGLAFSPDGQRLALAGRRLSPEGDAGLLSTIRVLDVATGQEVFETDVAGDMICGLAFSPDNRTLAAIGMRHGTLLMHDWTTGRDTRTQAGVGTAGDLTFSPDGARIAIAGRALVKILDATTAREVLTLRPPLPVEGDPGSSPKVRFSPDGERLVVNMGADAICLWDARALSPDEREAEARGFLWHVQNALNPDPFGRDFHLRQVARREPLETALRLERGRLFTSLGRFDQAAADFKRVLDEAPSLTEHWLARGDLFCRFGHWDEAAADYARGLALDGARPDSGQAHLQACVLVTRKDRQGYRQLCERLQQRFKEWGDGEAAFLVARIGGLAPDGSPDGSRQAQLIRQAQTLTPSGQSGSAYNCALGRAYYRAGQYRTALPYLQQSLDQSIHWAGHCLAWPLLAMCHYRLGQVDEARMWLAKAQAFTRIPPEAVFPDWFDFLVLRREAETLLSKERSPERE